MTARDWIWSSPFTRIFAENLPIEANETHFLDLDSGNGSIGLYCLIEKQAGSVTFSGHNLAQTWKDVQDKLVSRKVSASKIRFNEGSFNLIPDEVVAKHTLIGAIIPYSRHGALKATDFFKWYAALPDSKPDAIIGISSLLGESDTKKAMRAALAEPVRGFVWKVIKRIDVPPAEAELPTHNNETERLILIRLRRGPYPSTIKATLTRPMARFKAAIDRFVRSIERRLAKRSINKTVITLLTLCFLAVTILVHLVAAVSEHFSPHPSGTFWHWFSSHHIWDGLGTSILALTAIAAGFTAIKELTHREDGAVTSANAWILAQYKMYLSVRYQQEVRRPAWIALCRARTDDRYKHLLLAGLAGELAGNERIPALLHDITTHHAPESPAAREKRLRSRDGHLSPEQSLQLLLLDVHDDYHRIQDILGFFTRLRLLPADPRVLGTCNFFYDHWRSPLKQIVDQLADYVPGAYPVTAFDDRTRITDGYFNDTKYDENGRNDGYLRSTTPGTLGLWIAKENLVDSYRRTFRELDEQFDVPPIAVEYANDPRF